MKDGKKVIFSRKTPKKPLTMLKALITLGGKDVTESGVSDILWPGAEGDAAHRTFITTLSRLRQLISIDKVILLQEGLMTLNRGYCWVDLWAFEELIDQADYALNDGDSGKSILLLRKVIEMYRGDFLSCNIEEPWTASLRECLRNKFIRSIVKLGSYWEETKRFEMAIGCYSRGLEVCNLAEELYQRLMICYHRIGCNADAVGVYKRLENVLYSTAGISPSSKTECIFKRLTLG